MTATLLRRYALSLLLGLSGLAALPASAISLEADKAEIGVGETAIATLRGKPFIAVVTSWTAGGGLEMVENDSDRAIVKGASPGSGEVKVKVNGKTYRANIKVTKAADDKVQMSVDPAKEKDEFPMKLQGWARVMGLSDARTAIARMLYEVNTGARSPENFYRELGRQGLTLFDVIEVRSALVSNPDQSFLRSVLGATSSGGGTAVEKTLLMWRREQTKAAVNEVLKRFIAEGRVPANGFNLIVSDVGKWATQADTSLTFTGDIDFSFVSNDTAYVEALKAAYAEVIKRRTGLDPIALDSVCTAHGKAGLEVYIGRHGMAFAEEQMKINEVVDMRTGARTKVEGDNAVRTIGSLLTIERHLADTEGVEAPKPAVDTEPGLSMEMVRHFDHDIAKSGIYDMGNAVVKAAKYLDRSYKALEKAGGAPTDPAMAEFARRITELANAKPQSPATRNETTRLISDFLGSPPRVVWEPGGDKFVLTIDQSRVTDFHRSATRAMWDTVKQGSNARTAALDQRLRDLLEAQRKGAEEKTKVDEDVAKLRKEMVELVDMVEAEVKAAHGMDIPVEVHTNNAKVKAMLDTLAKHFGVKALSPDELKDKKFVEELLRAQANHPSDSRLEALKSYVMEKAARSAEMSMKGVEKVNNIMDFIDDGLLGHLRGDSDFAAFEAEMKAVRQANLDPRLRAESMGRLGAMKTQAAAFIKKANKTYNDALQATAAGRQGMKFMMVYGLADEMRSYRDAWNDQGWSGMATEVFRRRIPFGSAVESAVMGNTLRAGWDVVTTLIPPLGLPEAAIGLGQAIGTQYHATYWNEQLALFSDTLYENAKFKLVKVDSYDTTKVGEYRLTQVTYRGIAIDLAQFAEQTRDQVDALRQQVGRGRLDWNAYRNEFTGLTNWMEVDRTFQHTLSANDPVLQLLDEMVSHPAVGQKLIDRLAEKGLVRWEEIKLGYLTNLIKHLEDRKQADQALGAGQLPEMFRELKETAADLGVEKQVMAGLDAEVDTNNLKKLMNWLWDSKRAVLGQAPTESETARAAQVVKRYLDAYREIKKLRAQAEQQLGYGVSNDGSTRYLTGEYFLTGRADPDLKAARAWMQHITQMRAAVDASLLEVKRALLPNVGLDQGEDKRYQGLLLPHQLWMKPYRDWAGPRNDLTVLDYAVRHDKERRRLLADYKDLLTKLAPVQLTVSLSDASNARKTVSNATARLSPTDSLGKPASASGSGRLVLGAPSGRYSLSVEAPGYRNANRELVLGRNLDPAPKVAIALTPTGKPDDKKEDNGGKDDPNATTPGGSGLTGDGGQTGADGGMAGGGAGGDSGPDGPLPSMSCGNASGTFDKEPFNGLQLRYGISGVCIGPYKDSDGFTHLRRFKILGITGNTITVSGSSAPYPRAPCHSWAGSFWFQTDVTLSVGGKSVSYSSPKPCERKSETQYNVAQPGYSFNLSLPVPKDKKEVGISVSIRQTFVNPRFGDRSVLVDGSGTALQKVAGIFPEGGQDGVPPPPALLVSLEGPKDTVQLGQPLTFTANTEGGKPPYGHAWSGAEGSGPNARSAHLTPKKPGELTVEVTASDSAGQTAKASNKLKVEAPKLVLNGITGQAIYGSTARLTVSGLPGVTPPADPCAGRSYTARGDCEQNAATASAAPGAPRYRFVWQSTPGLSFDPGTSENAATTVTYDRMGAVKVWCEVLVEDEGAWTPIGETEQLTVTVGPPSFELTFSPPQGQGMVGQAIRALLRASPDVPANLIDYRWLEPPTSNRAELVQPASEIEFRAKDVNKPVVLEVLARAPYHGDEIARISGSYTGKAYTVKVTAQEPPNRPMIWDPAKGGLKPVPKDAWLTDERITLRADLSGGPPPATVRWRWRANEGTSLGNDISQTPSLTRHEAGTVNATAEAVDGEGAVLGSGSISLNVIAPPKEPGKPADGGVAAAMDSDKVVGHWGIMANNYSGKLEVAKTAGGLAGRVLFDVLGRWEHLTDVRFDGRTLSFTRPEANQRYSGTLSGGKVSGSFSSGGASGYGWSMNHAGPTSWVPPGAPVKPAAALIASYDLDGDLRDGSGQQRQARNEGATPTADRFGKPNGAMLFNGRAFIELPLDINPEAMPQLTFSAWVRADDASPVRQVMSHDNGGFDRSLGIDTRGGGHGWSLFTGSGVLGYKPVETGRWVFVAGVWDQATGKTRLHVGDAVFERDGRAGGGHGKVSLGRNPSYGEHFIGAIDEVRFHARALSREEITTVARQGASAPQSASTGPAYNVAGRWRTSEGEMTLTQQGGSVRGNYTNDGGEVVGQMSGNVLEGFWIENGSSERCATAKNGRFHWGRIRYVFEGGKFTGQWSYCDKPLSGAWTGERIGGVVTPPVGGASGGLNRDDLLSRTWRFGRGDGSVISGQVRLNAAGRMEGYYHPNEDNWVLENGVLVFRNPSGQAITRFTSQRTEGGRLVLSGPFLPNPSGSHVLTEIGRDAAPPPQVGSGNLARGKPASQSSTSQWSHANDAGGAVDGVINGSYSFHTNHEANPWWQVDLGGGARISEVRLYNRLDCCAERARTVQVMLSDDGRAWRTVYRHDGSVFGGKDGKPLKISLGGERGRYVRLQLNETQWFHLDEVEVYGSPDGASPPFVEKDPRAKVLFESGNIGGTQNRPTQPTRITLNGPHQITLIENYHWNNARGAPGGSIALRADDGRQYGPWPVRTRPGQGGAPSVYWTANPDQVLPAGTYTVVDSDPASWSHNGQSGGRGFTRLEGYPVGSFDGGRDYSSDIPAGAQILRQAPPEAQNLMQQVDEIQGLMKGLKGLFK